MKTDLNFFANVIGSATYLPDVNFCLAAMAKLSHVNTIPLRKDMVIKSANILQNESISLVTPDGAIWDDIFSQLKDDNLINTDVYNVSLTNDATEIINAKFPNGI